MEIGFDRVTELAEEGLPFLVTAGTEAEGEYYCADCGYGVAVRRELPRCPMCGGETWEPPATSAFSLR